MAIPDLFYIKHRESNKYVTVSSAKSPYVRDNCNVLLSSLYSPGVSGMQVFIYDSISQQIIPRSDVGTHENPGTSLSMKLGGNLISWNNSPNSKFIWKNGRFHLGTNPSYVMFASSTAEDAPILVGPDTSEKSIFDLISVPVTSTISVL